MAEKSSSPAGKMTTLQVQLLLLYLGYAPGQADGVEGPRTQEAVRLFQQEQGTLTPDGVTGEKTQQALRQAVAQGFQRPQAGEEDFWNEIENFEKEEFACKCGGKFCHGYPAHPQEALVRAAQKVRDYFGVPVTVSSGLRCPAHNRAVGGVSNSRHLTGKAVDFCVRGFSAALVLDFVSHLPQIRYCYAIDGNFVHMDIL